MVAYRFALFFSIFLSSVQRSFALRINHLKSSAATDAEEGGWYKEPQQQCCCFDTKEDCPYEKRGADHREGVFHRKGGQGKLPHKCCYMRSGRCDKWWKVWRKRTWYSGSWEECKSHEKSHGRLR